MSPWRNRLARSAVNRKVGGSSPPGDGLFSKLLLPCPLFTFSFFLTLHILDYIKSKIT